jgi:hypothetical protein
MRQVKASLRAAGMPHARSERRAGRWTLVQGELTGLTSGYGATGFSVRPDPDVLSFNVVISGREAGVSYEKAKKRKGGGLIVVDRPVNPEILCPRIADVFASLNFSVRDVRKAPVKLMWEDDIDYEILTDPLPRHRACEHDLIAELVDLASFETSPGEELDLEGLRTAHAIYFALRAVPADVLAEHLDAARVQQLVRRARREGAPGELEHWLAVRRAQQGGEFVPFRRSRRQPRISA